MSLEETQKDTDPYEGLEYISDYERMYGVSDEVLDDYRRHTDNLRRFDTPPYINLPSLEGFERAQVGLLKLRDGGFNPTAQTNLFETARKDFVHSTAVLEGLPVSLEDVNLILSEDMVIPNHPLKDHLEIIDINEAFDLMIGFVKEQRTVSVDSIKKIHATAARHLPDCEPGNLRWDQRYVTSRVIPPPPKYVEPLLIRAVDWYNEKPSLERAAAFHCLFEDIHPFQDGNGRTGRIMLDSMLLSLGYPVIALKPDLDHARAYHHAIRTFTEDLTKRDATPFANLVIESVNASIAREINRLEQKAAKRNHEAPHQKQPQESWKEKKKRLSGTSPQGNSSITSQKPPRR